MRFILLWLIVLTVAVGCSQKSQNEASPKLNKTENKHQVNIKQNQVKVKQTVPPKREIKNPQQVADHLEKLAASIPHVVDATCVVIGNTAIVGVNVDANLDRARVGTVKYSVSEALSKDPYGVHAIVTADLDIAERLRDMSKDIRRGRPIAGFAEELADIIGRVMPQLPRDIVPLNEPPTPSKDSQKLQHKNL